MPRCQMAFMLDGRWLLQFLSIRVVVPIIFEIVMTFKRVNQTLICALLLGVLTSTAYSQSLSCQMQSMLVKVAAMARDTGSSRGQVASTLAKAGDLSKAEINAVVSIVFDSMKNESPETIEKTVYAICARK